MLSTFWTMGARLQAQMFYNWATEDSAYEN